MIEKKIAIQNKLGLHARAASVFVNVAQEFASEITVTNTHSSANGKSIMKMMMLQAVIGSEIELRVEGEDEIDAMASLIQLIEKKFGEDE